MATGSLVLVLCACASDTISVSCVLRTAYCKVGLGICYDMRFAEMAQIYGQKGEAGSPKGAWAALRPGLGRAGSG